MLRTERVAFKLAVGNSKKKINEINPLSKFLSPLISSFGANIPFPFRGINSGLGIICGPIWRIFAVLGSFVGPHISRV